MIVLYTSPGCASCKKVKNWLNEHDIDYIEKNTFTSLLQKSEIKYLLLRSDNGTDDIVSKRSKIIKQRKIDVDSMTIDELTSFITHNPSVLKRPIMLSAENFLVGYDAEKIDIFKKNRSSLYDANI